MYDPKWICGTDGYTQLCADGNTFTPFPPFFFFFLRPAPLLVRMDCHVTLAVQRCRRIRPNDVGYTAVNAIAMAHPLASAVAPAPSQTTSTQWPTSR